MDNIKRFIELQEMNLNQIDLNGLTHEQVLKYVKWASEIALQKVEIETLRTATKSEPPIFGPGSGPDRDDVDDVK